MDPGDPAEGKADRTGGCAAFPRITEGGMRSAARGGCDAAGRAYCERDAKRLPSPIESFLVEVVGDVAEMSVGLTLRAWRGGNLPRAERVSSASLRTRGWNIRVRREERRGNKGEKRLSFHRVRSTWAMCSMHLPPSPPSLPWGRRQCGLVQWEKNTNSRWQRYQGRRRE